MQICNIGKYVITDIAEADEFLMKNYESKGELSQNIAEWCVTPKERKEYG